MTFIDKNYHEKIFGSKCNDDIFAEMVHDYQFDIFPKYPTITLEDQTKMTKDQLNHLYPLLKKIQDYFCHTDMESIRELCKKYPELEAEIGYHLKKKRKLTKIFIAKNIAMLPNLHIYHFINDADMGKSDDSVNQIAELEMPTSVNFALDVLEI